MSTHTSTVTRFSTPLILLVFFGLIHCAVASEITGTLSSDGSTGNPAVRGETTGSEIEGGITAPQGQLQGTVIGGAEVAGAATSHSGTLDTTTWLSILGGGILIALSCFLWGRRSGTPQPLRRMEEMEM